MLRTWMADQMRKWADRIDYEGAPKAINYSFTFENRRGIVFREDGKGCPLWYYGDADHQRAHSDADTDHAIVDWAAGTARFGR
jgi:hypothetical protein